MSKFTITNGRVILPDNVDPIATNIHIGKGQICAIDDALPESGAKTIDAKGAIVAPGIIDLGVFAIDKPACHFGGVTRCALMPDQSPVLDLPAMVKNAAMGGKPDLWVHPLAAASASLKGEKIAEIALMHASGAKAVATGRGWIANSGLMHKIMAYCASLDLTLIVHSEDAGLTGNAFATQGETATLLGLTSAPAIAEAMSVARDLALVEETGASVHFRQITTARAFDLVREAKSKGLPVTCGITPAHFQLSDIAVSDFRTFAKISPPLRSEDDRQACLTAIADGTIDVIASGHDPRGPEDKRLPFADAEPGMAGAETLLALSLGLVRDGHISLTRLFEMLAANPARILKVQAGAVEVGLDADIILIDPDAPWQIDGSKMAATAGNTPFDKLPTQGRVLGMFKGGKSV